MLTQLNGLAVKQETGTEEGARMLASVPHFSPTPLLICSTSHHTTISPSYSRTPQVDSFLWIFLLKGNGTRVVRRLRMSGMSNSRHCSDRDVLVGFRHEKSHQ